MVIHTPLSFQKPILAPSWEDKPVPNSRTPILADCFAQSFRPELLQDPDKTLDKFRHNPHLMETLRKDEAMRMAVRFDRATLGRRVGANEHEMKLILRHVANQHLQSEFNVAVRNLALHRGILVRDAGEVIDRKLGGNFLTRFFKAPPRQTCHDYLEYGTGLHASTPWENRRYGMWRSGADFVGLCKRHPAVSFSVIAAVSYLGDRYPFVGAISGVALMAWGAVMSAINEYKAAFQPATDAQKAQFYEQSGENLAAILMTLPGYHGINEGIWAGINRFKAVMSDQRNPVLKVPQGAWKAISLDKHDPKFQTFTPHQETTEALSGKTKKKRAWVGWVNRALFVTGLFDNVLLPFNWLADQLADKE